MTEVTIVGLDLVKRVFQVQSAHRQRRALHGEGHTHLRPAAWSAPLLHPGEEPADHSHDRSQAFLQGDLTGGTGDKIVWMCKAGDGTETTVEQTLIRGLVTA